MSEPRTYTANDIERYYRGDMTAAEMHRLEKAAMDDPILADMLDGYRHTATPSSDLIALQQKLQQRIAGDERKGAVVHRMQWLKIAALCASGASSVAVALTTPGVRDSRSTACSK